MDLLNFLGNLSGQQQPQMPGFAGGQFPTGQMPAPQMGQQPIDLNAALQRNAALGQQQQAQKPKGGFFRQGGTFSNVLGAIGDALLVHSGRNPVYAPAQQRRRSGEALANYLGNLDPGLAELISTDPELGMSLYKMKNPAAKEPPAFVQEYLYRQGLPDDQRKSFDEFANMRKFNPFAAPITLGPGDTYEGPGGGQPEAQEQTATGPNGEKVRYNPQSGQWEPMGGATGSEPSPTFP